MIDSMDSYFSSLPFDFNLANLQRTEASLAELWNTGGPLEGERVLLDEDSFRGMPKFFALHIEESLEPLFKNIPEGLAPNDMLKARANILLRHAINNQE